MEILELQLRVQGLPNLDDATRNTLIATGGYSALPLRRVSQIWHGSVPGQLRLSLNVQGAAVFVTDDWVVSIHGKRLIDCVGSLCAIVSTLDSAFNASVTIDLLTTSRVNDAKALFRQLDRERTLGRVKSVFVWAFTLLAGGLLGALIQSLVS